MIRIVLAVFLLSLVLPRMVVGQEVRDQPAKLIDYYGTSILPGVIPTDFSWITRYYACFEVGDRILVATKLWPIGKHDVFTSSRRLGPNGDPTLSIRYDSRDIWVTFATGQKVKMAVDHSRANAFHEARCKAANQESN
jgi:hypothetical protein